MDTDSETALSTVLGRRISYRAAGIREFRAYECDKGTPAALINVMTGICLAARTGLAAHGPPVPAGLPAQKRSGPLACQIKRSSYPSTPSPAESAGTAPASGRGHFSTC